MKWQNIWHVSVKAVLRCRRGQDFGEKYLKKGFSEKITVYRVLDSRKEKPSTYCKHVLEYKNVKSYEFIYEYFCDIDVLINALHEYRRVAKVRRNEKTLWDLLKQKC